MRQSVNMKGSVGIPTVIGVGSTEDRCTTNPGGGCATRADAGAEGEISLSSAPPTTAAAAAVTGAPISAKSRNHWSPSSMEQPSDGCNRWSPSEKGDDAVGSTPASLPIPLLNSPMNRE